MLTRALEPAQRELEPVEEGLERVLTTLAQARSRYNVRPQLKDAEQSRLLETLCGTGSGHQAFVVTVSDEVVGFVTDSLDEKKQVGEIGLNAMHPEHSGHGIGAAMYAFVLERMKSAGMKVATVSTGGDPSHAPARRAYEKAGFGPAVPSVSLYRLL